MGVDTLRLPATLSTECDSVENLAAATNQAFASHPDYTIITSFPGLADTSGARLLAEIGDDRVAAAATARGGVGRSRQG
jgi:hypothetical protein